MLHVYCIFYSLKPLNAVAVKCINPVALPAQRLAPIMEQNLVAWNNVLMVVIVLVERFCKMDVVRRSRIAYVNIIKYGIKQNLRFALIVMTGKLLLFLNCFLLKDKKKLFEVNLQIHSKLLFKRD